MLKWTEDEVTVWLRELGPWTEEKLAPVFQSSHIGKTASQIHWHGLHIDSLLQKDNSVYDLNIHYQQTDTF